MYFYKQFKKDNDPKMATENEYRETKNESNHHPRKSNSRKIGSPPPLFCHQFLEIQLHGNNQVVIVQVLNTYNVR